MKTYSRCNHRIRSLPIYRRGSYTFAAYCEKCDVRKVYAMRLYFGKERIKLIAHFEGAPMRMVVSNPNYPMNQTWEAKRGKRK